MLHFALYLFIEWRLIFAQDYGSSANDFIPVMLQSITTSMRRSYARHSGTSSASSDGGYIKPALPAVYNLLD